MNRPATAVALIASLVYVAASLDHLSVFPPVGEDEPWIAAAPYKLATQGVYGSDLFAGYYGVERHNYQHMPLYPLAQAGLFKLLGVGVFQMRVLPVACGLLILWCAILVGRQMGGDRLAGLAAILLVGQRVATGDARTGILLLDSARVNRYDVAVPVFGLTALWAFNRAERRGSRPMYALSGLLAGLASLTHLFGAFWLAAFVSILLYRRGWRLLLHAQLYMLIAGFAATWVPWIAYVAAGWPDFIGQMRFVAERFDLLEPSFYITNLLGEIDRYRALDLLDTARRPYVARPGAWTALAGVPVALAWMIARGRRATAACALGGASVAHGLLFAALLKVKSASYLIALWPMAVLALAWLGVTLWDRHPTRWMRTALAALLALILLEGGLRIAHRHVVATRTTPYEGFSEEVAGYIPAGALVLGLQHYWLGLRRYPYRTWLLPINYAHPRYYHEPLSLDQALERVNPDVILIDRYMGRYFEEVARPDHPRHRDCTDFQRFMSRHGATLAGVVDDRTYGTMRIYRVRRSGTGTGTASARKDDSGCVSR